MTFHAKEQLREDVQEKLFDYLEEIEGIEPERLVFVDEAAANYQLVRTYGRAKKGERAYGRRPHNWGGRVSLIGALGFDGMRTGMFWEGYIDAQAFEIFVDDYLIPNLNLGDVVVWDNYSVHKRLEYEKKINEAGAFLLFLPPYTPELSPIEHTWAKVKAIMRAFRPSSVEEIWDAFCAGFSAVTGGNAKGWFKGCGYCP